MNHHQVFISIRLIILIVVFITCASSCAPKSLLPFADETPPLVQLPLSNAEIIDGRGRFREIFCAILAKRGMRLPDYRPCQEALVRVGKEPKGTGQSVDLGPTRQKLIALFVPGVGWDCIADWLDMDDSIVKHLRQFGYDMQTIEVDGLSSTTNNARQIRNAIMEMEPVNPKPNFVLVGYSKGAPDILEALVTYPEINQRIAAVVSVSGAIGGTPLADDTPQSLLALLRFWPEARCKEGDGGAIESLRPSVRKTWLAEHPLPKSIPYFSLVTYPKPDRISSILNYSYKKLRQVDARNDSQLLVNDQLIPSSILLGFANADHWALAVPIARSHPTIGVAFADQNQYPREVMFEAVLRFIEEQITMAPR